MYLPGFMQRCTFYSWISAASDGLCLCLCLEPGRDALYWWPGLCCVRTHYKDLHAHMKVDTYEFLLLTHNSYSYGFLHHSKERSDRHMHSALLQNQNSSDIWDRECSNSSSFHFKMCIDIKHCVTKAEHALCLKIQYETNKSMLITWCNLKQPKMDTLQWIFVLLMKYLLNH